MSTRLGDVTTATQPDRFPLLPCSTAPQRSPVNSVAKSKIKTKNGSAMAYFRRQKPQTYGLSTRREIPGVRHSATVSRSGRDKVNPLSTLRQTHKNRAL